MTDTHANDNPVDDLAEEFARRWRDGERPSVEDYAVRFPQWAADIRDLFPAVVMMEQLKPRPQEQPTANPPPGDRQAPEQLGDYRILREIGRGGMGVVYEAQHEALGRRVAVKVLPASLFLNEKRRSRFRRESQAAARLHHTNIVPVFGVGEQDGQCFYVMQLIHGKTLDALLAQATEGGIPIRVGWPDRKTIVASQEEENGQSSTDSNKHADVFLTPEHRTPARTQPAISVVTGTDSAPRCHRTVARIGVRVADALAYAHAQGVLHRDIKPSNLLLDEQGTVWVTDFGVAKLVEEAQLTQSGELIGTLRYMPPERFHGVSDARGDVYSLGITLYEILARRPAFPDATPHHLIQLVTQAELPALRTLDPTIPADLETIVLKAASGDSVRRYQTAGELADDLRRFLDDRPILARRAGPVEQVWRWGRRNRALAASAASVFLLMVAITAVSVVAYVKTAAANRETATANRDMEKALAAEKAQREQAERASTLALDALNRVYNRFAPTRLVVTPEASNEEGVELPPQPALPPEAVPLMEDLLRTYEQIARSGGEFPQLQAQAAEANYRIGNIRQRLARFEDAATAYRVAIELYTPLPLDSADSVRIKLARTCNELGGTLRALQQFDEADQMYQRAIRLLSDAPKRLADRPECRYELARASFTFGQRDQLASPRGGEPRRLPPSGERGRGGRASGGEPPPPSDRGPSRAGRPPPPPSDRPSGSDSRSGGEHAAHRAAALLEQLVSEFPSVPEYRHLLACCYRDIPPDPAGRGQPRTKSNTDRAVELLRQLVADFPKVPDYRFDLCETLSRASPPDRFRSSEGANKVRERLEEAIALSAELVAQYPHVPQYAASHAQYLDRLGNGLFQARSLDEAEKAHRKAVALQSRLVKQHTDVLAYGFWLSQMECSLARVLSDRGELQEARSRLETAVERLEGLPTKDPRLGSVRSFLGTAYRELAQVLRRGGDVELATKALRKAEELDRRQGPGPPGPRGRSGEEL
jgi:serine/threonine protein kinase/tetratricopeptide (TPR) repeat protein